MVLLGNAQNVERLVFYNCENFFDCYDEIGKQDEAFLPSSLKHWTYHRYKKKLSNLARVITAIGGDEFPTIIGLAEIENITVINDIVNHSSLKWVNYSFVHRESPDFRGIDVALLYNSKKCKIIKNRFIQVCTSFKHKRYSRDILYSKAVLLGRDTLHLFVNHWSSRLGGKRRTEYKRIKQAEILSAVIDSIILCNNRAKIIVMGDFNDTPKDKSIKKYLCTKSNKLRNLSLELVNGGCKGTIKYKAFWSLFDQIIVSSSVKCTQMSIFSPLFILQEDKKYAGYKPMRTYNGMRYQEGYSDHLPVFIDLLIDK